MTELMEMLASKVLLKTELAETGWAEKMAGSFFGCVAGSFPGGAAQIGGGGGKVCNCGGNQRGPVAADIGIQLRPSMSQSRP